ncbi:hypothetical protein ACU4GG_18335 [Streptomyces nojiriensis]
MVAHVLPNAGLSPAPASTLLPHTFGAKVIGTETLLPASTPGE